MLIQILASAAAIAQTPAAAPATTEADGAQLEDIVVTAQKREERLQEIPLTVTAVTGSQLEKTGLLTSRDLTQLSPGLVFSQQSIVVQPTIRGVGGRGVAPGDEGTVPVYVDGVYQPVQHANAFQLSNIARIEVLKGPQGTLFGRNAVGGAINVLTLDPATDFQLKLAGTYARFDRREGELYVSVPVSDRLGVNFSGFVGADDGYIRDLVRGGMANPSSTTALRGKIVFQTGDDGEIKLIGFYTNAKDPTPASTRPLGGNTAGRLGVPPAVIAGPYESSLDFQAVGRYHTAGTSAQLRQGFGGVELVALGSYQNTHSYSQTDSDSSARRVATNEVTVRDKTYTAEARLSSVGDGPLKWIVGGYYFNGKACYCPLTNNGTAPIDATQRSKAFALFAEATYSLTDALSITGGLRYSDEKRSIYTLRSDAFIGQGSKRFSDISPRASILYALSDKARIYATYSQGFKSGVYNTATTTLPLTPVRPETLTAYEIGLKTEPSRQLRFNLSAFYYDYVDLQVSSRNATTNLTVLQNAATAENYGFEAQVDAAVTTAFNLSGSVAYTHARFKSFPGANILVPRPDLGGNTNAFRDVSGNAIPKSPDFTANLRGDYTVPLSTGSVTLAGNVYYSAKYFSEFSNRVRTDAFVLANARITWASGDEHYRVTAFVDNLTNERYPITISTTATADVQVDSRPRVFGVKLQFTY
jgi:iron complex outermembrane receptor protein